MKHTEGKLVSTGGCDIYSESSRLIASTYGGPISESSANAAEFVRRWNAHDKLTRDRDALLEACKAATSYWGPSEDQDDAYTCVKNILFQMEKAISQAEESQ